MGKARIRLLSVLFLSSIVSLTSAAHAADQVVDDCSSDTEPRADLAILRAAVGLPTSPSCPPVWDCHTL